MLVSLHDEKFTRFKLLELRMSRQITVEHRNKTYLGLKAIKKNREKRYFSWHEKKESFVETRKNCRRYISSKLQWMTQAGLKFYR